MQYRMLGKTGINVSRICFGALTVGPLQAGMPVGEGAALIRYALEQGINFIDTAKYYRTYLYIREALKGWGRPVVIASKSYDYTKEGMKKSVEEARLALDRDYIDIFMLHEQESELTLAGHKAALDYLWEAKSQGIIKAVGLSTHTVKLVKLAADRDDIEVIHPIVNYRGLGLEDGTRDDMLTALEYAHNKGKGLYAMKPLGGGNLLKEAEKALLFVFGLPYLDSVAIGCRMKAEIDYNIAVLEGKRPEPAAVALLQTAGRRLSVSDWCAGCGKCVEKCPSQLLEIRNGKACLAKDGCLFCGYCAGACPHFAIKVF